MRTSGEKDILVAVGAVIQDEEDRILLVRHVPERGGFWKGKWICPGGGLRRGEKIEDGIRREVREETGLEIALLQPLAPFARIVTRGGKTVLHVIYIDYLARALSHEVRPGQDVGEALWVEKERLPEVWESLHQDTRKLLQGAGLAKKGVLEGLHPSHKVNETIRKLSLPT